MYNNAKSRLGTRIAKVLWPKSLSETLLKIELSRWLLASSCASGAKNVVGSAYKKYVNASSGSKGTSQARSTKKENSSKKKIATVHWFLFGKTSVKFMLVFSPFFFRCVFRTFPLGKCAEQKYPGCVFGWGLTFQQEPIPLPQRW